MGGMGTTCAWLTRVPITLAYFAPIIQCPKNNCVPPDIHSGRVEHWRRQGSSRVFSRVAGTLFPALFTTNDIHHLPIESQDIEPLTTLPAHHKDPFDRLIAATCIVEGLTLASADPIFDAYGLTRLW